MSRLALGLVALCAVGATVVISNRRETLGASAPPKHVISSIGDMGPAARGTPGLRGPERLVGQKLMVSFRGTSQPPPSLLDGIRRGQVGGVILFSENGAAQTPASFRALASRLQREARAGHNPALLIAIDQEGGEVRRLPGPPGASALQLGTRSAKTLRGIGRETGVYLRSAGVNVDLAPVADVPAGPSFLGSRAFGRDVRRVEIATTGFVRGLSSAGVAATVKHYPGLGRAGRASTDSARVVVGARAGELDSDRRAFLGPIAAGASLVMISSALYPTYDAERLAVFSPKVLAGLRRLGFSGVTISDDLAAPPVRDVYGSDAAVLATNAGVDLLLYASSDWHAAYARLRRAVARGEVSRAELLTQAGRIAALKRRLAHYTQPGG